MEPLNKSICPVCNQKRPCSCTGDYSIDRQHQSDDVVKLRRELAEARATNTKLNRRCQKLESTRKRDALEAGWRAFCWAKKASTEDLDKALEEAQAALEED